MTDSTGGSRIRERSRTDEPDEKARNDRQESSGETCAECGGRLVHDEAQAEVHCEDCGCVADSGQIDHGPEWRAYDSRERDEKSRVGSPTTRMMHDNGLSTQIGWSNRDGYGNALSNRKQSKIRRLRTWNERARARDSKERNLKHALGELSRMSSALGLPDPVREVSSVIYRRALDEDLLRGRSIEGMATAALYAGSRIEGVPRSIDELAGVSRVDALEVERTYRYLTTELDLEIAPTDPESYIPRFASKLDCSSETERRARELTRTAVEKGVHSGRNPVGIAASALYAAARLTDEGIIQADVSDIANVSMVTIRNRYTEILDAVDNTGDG
jgi:transcription initiation factor TFIIB